MLALDITDQPMLVFWVIAALIALGPALHSWIKVYQFARGHSTDMSLYVTKVELAAQKAERDVQIKATIDRLEEKTDSIMDELTSIHRALGHVEGMQDASLPSMAPPVKPTRRRRRG